MTKHNSRNFQKGNSAEEAEEVHQPIGVCVYIYRKIKSTKFTFYLHLAHMADCNGYFENQ